MNKEAKIYIAGHRGLVGSALWRTLTAKGYTNLLGYSHARLNLLNQQAVLDFFQTEKPEYVFIAAARVGGIMANNTYRAQFIYENIQIQNNIIHASYLTGVKKLLFLGSSCIYPKDAPQPIKEDYLLTSPLEYTNEPYAIAKIAGIKMCEAYNLQYGTNFISVMPTNLYGPGDSYDLERSHVLPALIRKIYLARLLQEDNWAAIAEDLNRLPIGNINGEASRSSISEILQKQGIVQTSRGVEVILWGTGKPLREFLHSDDMADACVYIMEKVDFPDIIYGTRNEIRNTHINIGTGEDLSIARLANMVKQIVGFSGTLRWDTSKPDGTFRKQLDVSKLHSLGWNHKIDLEKGIQQVFNGYLAGEGR